METRLLGVLFPILLAVTAAAQGTAKIDYSARDANGVRTLSIDMTNVTGGTVTVYFGPGNSTVLSATSGITTFEWASGATVIITSSNGKKVTGVNRDPDAMSEPEHDDSGYDATASGPELELSS